MINIKISLFVILSFFAINKAKSQNYVGDDKFKAGLKAGISINMLNGDAFTKSYIVRGYSLGLYYRYKFKNGFHFQTEFTPAIRGARFNNKSDTGYQKINLLYIDLSQIIIKDLIKNSNTHCMLAGIQPSVLLQSWVYNSYFQLSPAARDIALNGMDFFVVAGYQYNKKSFGIQSMVKLGLTNINRGLNMHDHNGKRLGPTNDKGKIHNFSWELSLTF
ncbi:MAG: outer membrane beta-barrel protein [Bacteroidia bacterium]|nr:outer membrane beta-barrel protein [Bacteroidia bacterium]